jgi:drug/metabolite transporter (DMT)-like permease
MARPPEYDPPVDTLVLLILFGVLLFASPMVLWWTDPKSPWYLPYLLWLLLIGLGAWLFGRADDPPPGRKERRRGP